MLMVIIGAGASYDSSPDNPPSKGAVMVYRPPLADDLFQPGSSFGAARGQFPEFHDLIPELLPRAGRSLEKSLQRLQDEAASDPYRHQQLTAIRYYLQTAFRDLIGRWTQTTAGVTNYRALFGQIRHHRRDSEPVCVVTFNYDTLLENALQLHCGMEFNVLDDYVCGKEFQLFKLHGSQNWGRYLEGPIPIEISQGNTDPWGRPHEIIKHAGKLSVSNIFAVDDSVAKTFVGPPLYPAIAIPVLNKNVFECPPAHVQMLTDLIPRVSKILTIGWRASEKNFLYLLQRLPAVKIITVAGSVPEAEESLNKIRLLGMPVLDTECFANFSDTIAERRLDPLLST